MVHKYPSGTQWVPKKTQMVHNVYQLFHNLLIINVLFGGLISGGTTKSAKAHSIGWAFVILENKSSRTKYLLLTILTETF